ncbi:MAG: hypothetical protein MKZ95_04215, partial [Pirellulales bacterium]|nr:hypothetical protein [Pirellulales bacterium]
GTACIYSKNASISNIRKSGYSQEWIFARVDIRKGELILFLHNELYWANFVLVCNTCCQLIIIERVSDRSQGRKFSEDNYKKGFFENGMQFKVEITFASPSGKSI